MPYIPLQVSLLSLQKDSLKHSSFWKTPIKIKTPLSLPSSTIFHAIKWALISTLMATGNLEKKYRPLNLAQNTTNWLHCPLVHYLNKIPESRIHHLEIRIPTPSLPPYIRCLNIIPAHPNPEFTATPSSTKHHHSSQKRKPKHNAGRKQQQWTDNRSLRKP